MTDTTPIHAIKTDFGNAQANVVWEAIATYAYSGKIAAMNLGTDRGTGLVHQHTIDGHNLLAKFLVLVSLLPAERKDDQEDLDEHEDRQWDEPDEDDYLGTHAG